MHDYMIDEIAEAIAEAHRKAGRTPPRPHLVKAGLKSYFDARALAVWGVDDVYQVASEQGYPICEKVARDILKEVEDDQSAEDGINWESLEWALSAWINVNNSLWNTASPEVLAQYEPASYILRTTPDEITDKFFLFVDVKLDVVRAEVQKFADKGVTCCARCIPYGENLDLDLENDQEDQDMLSEAFADGQIIFFITREVTS